MTSLVHTVYGTEHPTPRQMADAADKADAKTDGWRWFPMGLFKELDGITLFQCHYYSDYGFRVTKNGARVHADDLRSLMRDVILLAPLSPATAFDFVLQMCDDRPDRMEKLVDVLFTTRQKK